MKRLLTSAAAMLVGVASVAQAQDDMRMDRRVSRFDLGIYAGAQYSSPWYDTRTVTLNATTTPTENDDERSFGPGFGPIFGAAATFWATPMFGVRAHGAYAPMKAGDNDDAFDNLGDRDFYELNTYIYDLDLMVRPFLSRTGLLSSMYAFVGGGGVTVDHAGEDEQRCETDALSRGACLSHEPSQSTVGQGTAGFGFDFFPLSSMLGVFGELGFHGYDSPVHVGDGWTGPITGRTGQRVAVADDRFSVTTRGVLGVKAMFGDFTPPPPIVIPPPIIEAPPAPVVEMRDIQVCVVQDGMLQNVTATYNTQTGDTMVAGRRFSEAFPATTGYAAGQTWFINNEPIMFQGRRYVRFGLPRVVGTTEVTRAGDVNGVGAFTEAGATGTPEIIYIPVRPGCEFQPYQREAEVRKVRG